MHFKSVAGSIPLNETLGLQRLIQAEGQIPFDGQILTQNAKIGVTGTYRKIGIA